MKTRGKKKTILKQIGDIEAQMTSSLPFWSLDTDLCVNKHFLPYFLHPTFHRSHPSPDASFRRPCPSPSPAREGLLLNGAAPRDVAYLSDLLRREGDTENLFGFGEKNRIRIEGEVPALSTEGSIEREGRQPFGDGKNQGEIPDCWITRKI
ncbi:hypothetical protein AVEN_127393-1 [Araneus ventricosus]|uniref:Uncharacterized protein n=1 Tax=Araneus ventricosus TaxID=182803 RepID=A0A4Y2EVM1_ARAVE|nr:hypothetical protein AVEN_127393-1 [Araneus ventricosus]